MSDKNRNVWRALRRLLPRLVRVLRAATPELLEALADGRITPEEGIEIGIAIAEAISDQISEPPPKPRRR
jgi:hypothetical protein